MEVICSSMEYLRTGGPVMVPIILLSLLLWGLIVERLLFFRRMERNAADEPGVIMELNKCSLPPAAATGLCVPVFRELIGHASGDTELDRRFLDHCVLRQRKRLWRSLDVMATLAAAAPMLGLLGTVIGMIGTFEAITVVGAGGAKALASGISEALITTQSGLVVGIPGLFMSRIIRQRARRMNNRLEETAMAARRCLR